MLEIFFWTLIPLFIITNGMWPLGLLILLLDALIKMIERVQSVWGHPVAASPAPSSSPR